MRIMISGPISNMPENNYPAFDEAAKRLESQGHIPVSPADMGRAMGSGHPWEAYMRGSIQLLLTCEAIAMLPGWVQSRGARLERHIARELGMAVYLVTPTEIVRAR